MYYLTIRAGLTKLQAGFKAKEELLRKADKLEPSGLEKVMGVLCTLCMLCNFYFKWESMTLIFMFNPCHIVCVSTTFT